MSKKQDALEACQDAKLNTDREIWREIEGDHYAPSIHVTEGGGIGINCGGHVIVMSVKEWHKLAQDKVYEQEGRAPVASVAPQKIIDARKSMPNIARVLHHYDGCEQDVVNWYILLHPNIRLRLGGAGGCT